MEKTKEPSKFFKEYFTKYTSFALEIVKSSNELDEKNKVLGAIAFSTIDLLIKAAKDSKNPEGVKLTDGIIRELEKIIRENTMH